MTCAAAGRSRKEEAVSPEYIRYLDAIRADLRWKNETAARVSELHQDDGWMADVLYRSIASTEIALIRALREAPMFS